MSDIFFRAIGLFGISSVLASAQISPPPKAHPLFVENGTGSGRYLAGTQVPVIAPPELRGSQFVMWQVTNYGPNWTVQDPFSRETTITMPGQALHIVALYANIKVWYPPGPIDPTSPGGQNAGLFLARNQLPTNDLRREMKIRVILENGGSTSADLEKFWNTFGVELDWFPKDPSVGRWHSQHVSFHDSKTGGTQLQRGRYLNRHQHFTTRSENPSFREASFWYEPQWTTGQQAPRTEEEEFRPPPSMNVDVKLFREPPKGPPGHNFVLVRSCPTSLLPVEVIDLAPKLKHETGKQIDDSNRPFAIPKANGMVEEDAANNRIAHRELKVRIGEPLKGTTVTWTMEPLFRRTPGPFPFEFRGSWTTAAASHRNRFEDSTAYRSNGFTFQSQESGRTTVGDDGFSAIRVNVPPWGLNKARIRIQIDGTSTPIDLIDLEVPGVIVIDPGHGIGAAGSSNAIGGSGDTTGVLEHEFALDVGTRMAADLRVRRELENLPIKIYMTRTGTGNKTFPDRTRIARDNGCDVYVSIHFNAVDGAPLRRHPFGMWDSTDNHNLDQDQALAVRMRQALQRAIATQEPEESRNAPTDGISSETHEANLQKGLDTCSDSTNITTPNYNGNIPGHTPCRAVLMELEWMSNNRADLLFNEGNSSLSSTANRMREEAAQAMADAAIENLYTQPSQ